MLFPCEANAVVESQPVAACKIGKITETSELILSASFEEKLLKMK